jgi:hypothetical protein
LTSAGDTSIRAGSLRGRARRKAALARLQLIRLAMLADRAHEPDIVPRQERLQVFQLHVQRLLFLQPPLGLFPPLVLVVRLGLGRQWRGGPKSSRVAPVASAERQDGGGGGAARARGRVAGQRVQTGPDAERGGQPDGRGQSRETVPATCTRESAWEAGEIRRVVWGCFCIL